MKKLLLLLIPLLVLLASPVQAAITCGDSIAFSDEAATDPETQSYTTPSGSNQVLFVGLGIRDTTPGVLSVTHAGNAMTSTSTGIASQSPSNAQLFYIVNPTSGTNDVVMTLGGVVLAAAAVIWTCSGVNTASPVHDATEAIGTGTAVTVTVPNLVAGDAVVDFMYSEAAAAAGSAPSIGANQTVLQSVDGGTEQVFAASYQAAADGGVMSWTITSDEWAQQAVALTPAAEAAILQAPPVPAVLFQ